jgi:hypothetical protein
LAVGGVGVVQAGGSFAAIYVNVTDSSVALRGGATFNGVGGVGVFEYRNVATGLRAVSVNVTRSAVSVANVSNGGGIIAVHGIGIAGSANTANNVSYTVSGDASNVTIAGVLTLSPTGATVGAVGIAGVAGFFSSARISVVNCNLYARDVGNPRRSVVGVCGIATVSYYGEDQIDGSRLNPLRRAVSSCARSTQEGVTNGYARDLGLGSVNGADREASRRRMAAAAIAAVDADAYQL